ncbi:Uncharacterised protein [Vibrio cholerae]|nr:Uncharacterised protein [Vibrio cholerae]
MEECMTMDEPLETADTDIALTSSLRLKFSRIA